MAQKKCMLCGQPIDESQKAVPYKNRYVHEKCFNNMLKVTIHNKRDHIEETEKTRKTKRTTKTKLPKAVNDYKTEEEFQEQNSFFEFIKRILHTEILPARVYKLADDYVKKYGFTYKGMENSICYFFLIQEHEVEGDGLGIIPYIYDEAQAFFLESEQTNEINNQLLDNDSDLYNTRTIKIKAPKIEPKLINIEQIGCDADC